MMRFLSVCSGIDAASVAWSREYGSTLEWRCAGYSEIEAFPRAVLQQRHHAVPVDWDHRWSAGLNFKPLFGDFTQIEAEHVGAIDLLVGWGDAFDDWSEGLMTMAGPTPANDNSRNYRREPMKASRLPRPARRDIYAWEIDSSLDPCDPANWTVVGQG